MSKYNNYKKLNDIDIALIKDELSFDKKDFGWEYAYIKPSNKFIDKLLNHYYLHEMCENFYDTEPDYDDDLYEKYYEYEFNLASIPKDLLKEYKDAHEQILRLREEYDKTDRLTYNNWQEPYAEGIWGYTQNKCDRIARKTLKLIRKKYGKSLQNRFFVTCNIVDGKKMIQIYFYGRDIIELDYWFIFVERRRYK